ncbi:MAG: alanine racemase [bacterium]|nr:alanine racemase [bacterium]
MKIKSQSYRTWLEVNLGAIARNTAVLKSALSGRAAMMAVVKSNAYGHGMVECAKAALKGGADWIAVDELAEALELRTSGIKSPVLVLGFTMPELYETAAKKGVSLTISSLDSLRALAKAKLFRRLKIHVKFDTGLHRQGIPESQVQQAVRVMEGKTFETKAIIEGAYTHFAAMEDPAHEDYSLKQAGAFKSVIFRLREKGFTPITHASASSGLLFSPDYYFDMARAGIAIYGLWPSPEIEAHSRRVLPGISLTPVLSWKTIVNEVKLVPKGALIGYDLTCEATRDSRIAVIPVGYWHGFPRSLSNSGEVLVGGKLAKVLGRVSMDMTVIDVTDIPLVKAGDEVVLLGKQGKTSISAEALASRAGTINYEIVTRINPLLPRVYLR